MTGPIVSFAWTTDAYLANLKDVTRRMWNDDYARRFRPGVEFQSWNKSPRFGGTYIDQAVVVVCKREPLIRLLEDRAYGLKEIRREGGLWGSPEEFVELFTKRYKLPVEQIAPYRLVFRRIKG